MRRPGSAATVWPYPGHRTIAEVWADDDRAIARGRITRSLGGPIVVPPVRLDRHPCVRCGVRSDIGCVHNRLGAA